MSRTGCVCDAAGWCHRHRVRKGHHWHYLCQTHQAYFDAWEEGRGPGQQYPERTDVAIQQQAAASRGGPGTELAQVLALFGIHDKAGCGCRNRAAKMDRWGCEKCRARLDRIVRWLEIEARRRKLPFSRALGRRLVKLAIWKAERRGSCAN